MAGRCAIRLTDARTALLLSARKQEEEAVPTQQFELYEAEQAVDPGSSFTMAEAQVWLDALRETWWWERFLPTVLKVEIAWGDPGDHIAGVGWFERDKSAGRMEFKRGTILRTRLLVHELAHVVAQARHDSKAHDPWFSRVYYELTYLICGPDEAKTLAESFDRHGIDYDAKGVT